jgi:hypothetical protein
MIGALPAECQGGNGWHDGPMRRIPVVVAAVSLAVAACGSGVSSPSASSSAVTPSAVAAPSTGPSSRTTSRPTASQAAVIPHDAPDLEARLPSAVDGVALTTFSVGPDTTFGGPGTTDPQGLKDIAAEIGDGSGAFGLAYAAPPDGAFNVFALRVDGADPSELATKFAQLTFAQTVGGTFEAAKLGGRDVVHIADPFSDIGDVWFYADGDTVLGVQAGSPAKAAALLGLIT